MSAESLSIAFASDTSIPISFDNDTDWGPVGPDTLRSASILGIGEDPVSDSNPVPISDAGGSITVDASDLDIRALASGTDSVAAVQSGTWNITNISGTVSLPTGAATEVSLAAAAASLDSIDTALAGTIAISAVSLPLPTGAATESTLASIETLLSGVLVVTATNLDIRDLASASDSVAAVQSGSWTVTATDGGASLTVDGTVAVSNLPTTVDTASGAAGVSTLRTVLATRHESASTPISVRISNGSAFTAPATAGRVYADSARNVYSSVNVTTAAWTQLIASTSATINAFMLFDSSGQTLELGVGGSGSETRLCIIPPGGFAGAIPITIPSGSRLSVKAISGTADVGEINFTGLS